MYRTYYSIRSSNLGYSHNSCILSGWPSKVHPDWSTTKIPQGVRINSWYSKIGWHKFPACSVYYRNLRYRIFLSRVLVGYYSLARDTKRTYFPLAFWVVVESRLSSYLSRNILKLLTIQILYKRSPPDWTTKSIWASLQQSISFIKEIWFKATAF